MDINKLSKVSAEALDNLSGGADEDGILLFDGKKKIWATLYADGETVKSPFSSEPCVYYEAEAYHETSGGSYHIGTHVSDNDFYIQLDKHLVRTDHVEIDFSHTFVEKNKTDEIPEQIKQGLKSLGWLETGMSHPEITVYEKVLKADKRYLVSIRKVTTPLPPSSPNGQPAYSTSYHFHFIK